MLQMFIPYKKSDLKFFSCSFCIQGFVDVSPSMSHPYLEGSGQVSLVRCFKHLRLKKTLPERGGVPRRWGVTGGNLGFL